MKLDVSVWVEDKPISTCLMKSLGAELCRLLISTLRHVEKED
jgi:hypothetical protein